MPQPLSRVRQVSEIRLFPSVAARQSQRAAQVSQVFEYWAAIETQLGHIFSYAMTAKNLKSVLRLYNRMNSSEARFTATMDLLEDSLEQRYAELASAIRTQIVKPVQKTRNKLAHWHWADSEELPGAILLIDPTEYVRYRASRSRRDDHNLPDEPLNQDRILVWKEKDLDDAILHSSNALEALIDLHRIQFAPSTDQRDRLYQKLSDEPSIQSALARKTVKNAP